MAFISYNLRGADDLSKAFRKLSADIQKEIALPAAKDAMDIVLKDAKLRADLLDDPKTFPDISKNIASLEDKQFYEETGSIKVSVGVRKTKKGFRGGNTFYWRHLEFGTVYIRARPFIRPALTENLEAVFREFIGSAKFRLLTYEA